MIAGAVSSADTRSVLVVESDDRERTRVAGELGRAGFAVLECPGPGPGVSCPVETGTACGLVEMADVVVLDPALESEAILEGVSPTELLISYLHEGKAIVVTSRAGTGVHPFMGERVRVVGRPADATELVRVIRELLQPPADPVASGRLNTRSESGA